MFSDEYQRGAIAASTTTIGERSKIAFCVVIERNELELSGSRFPYSASIDSESLEIAKTVESDRWQINVWYTARFDGDRHIAATEYPLVVGGKKFDLHKGRLIRVALFEDQIHFSQAILHDDLPKETKALVRTLLQVSPDDNSGSIEHIK